jgi:hypothetical protein
MNSSIAYRIRFCEQIVLSVIQSARWTKPDPIRSKPEPDRVPVVAPVKQTVASR